MVEQIGVFGDILAIFLAKCLPTPKKVGKQFKSMITSTVVFDHRGRATNDRPGSLELRVTESRRSYYINTGIKVLRREWKYGRIVDRPDCEALNERLDIICRRIDEIVNDCIERQAPLDVRRIKQEAWGEQTEAGTPFLDWVAVTIPTLDIKSGTRKHYNTTLTRLREYGRMRTWADLTSEGILAFDRWLHNLKINQSDAAKKMGKNESLLSDAAVYNYHKNMKGLIRRALFEGKITANPYERLRGQLKRGEKESVEYLTEDEVAAFMSLAPVAGTAMAVARDLFVFQLFTGFGFTDMQSFDIRNYKRVDGKWISMVPRTKTGVATVSQLLPPAVEVLERYGMTLPKMNNADYNHALKALGMAAGISTPLHSHLARHTFATFMLKNGVKVENLARMMGHRRITQTMRYAKVLAQSVHEDFDMIEQILNKQTK